MAITIRAETTGIGTGNAANQVTIDTSPLSGGIAGEYIVVVMGAGDDVAALAPPAGWTTGDRVGTSSGNDRQIGIFYLKLTGAPASSYTFTVGRTDNCCWWAAVLQDVDPTVPQDEAMSGNAVNNTVDDPTPAAPSITTATAGAFVLAGWANNYDPTATLPGGDWATRVDNLTNVDINFCLVSRTFASPGATGDVEITLDGVADCSSGQWAFRQSLVSASPSVS